MKYDIYCLLLAAPNQFSAPTVGSQTVVSSNGMQFVPQPMNYAGMPQQFVPASYGFYAQPMMHGAAVSAGFPIYGSSQRQLPAANGAPAGQGSNSSGMVAGIQPVAPQPAAGSWPLQMPPVVNLFLVSYFLLLSPFAYFLTSLKFVAYLSHDHKCGLVSRVIP